MPYYTCDTSTIISRKLTAWPDNFLASTVVLLELMASAADERERKQYEALIYDYRYDNSLIVPTFEDWLTSGKVLYWLTQERRRQAGGKAPKLKPGAAQRMALDALLAVSARRWQTSVITDNWSDFKAIQRYCKVKVVKASEFFK